MSNSSIYLISSYTAQEYCDPIPGEGLVLVLGGRPLGANGTGLALKVRDAGGDVEVNLWSRAPLDLRALTGRFLFLGRLAGKVYRGEYRINANEFTHVPWDMAREIIDDDTFFVGLEEPSEPAFLTEEEVDRLLSEIQELCWDLAGRPSGPSASSRDDLVSALIQEAHRHLTKFKWAPAARGQHHAFPGGLAVHVHSMLRIAKGLKQQYTPGSGFAQKMYTKKADWAVIAIAIVMHDAFKPAEYEPQTGEEDQQVSFGTFNDTGKLIGHTSLAAMAVYGVLVKHGFLAGVRDGQYGESGTPVEALGKNLLHCILSHHGRKEWGAAVEPATPEAGILHAIDFIDSRLG